MRILGISGSLRRGSHNRKLLRAASALLPPGAELVEWDGLATLPAFDEDLETTPPETVRAFFEAIEGADALLIATPEYNFSIPGVLKNVIDWLSRPPFDTALAGKPLAIMGAGGRLGSARAQYHLRQVCGCLSMLPVPRPEIFVLNAWEKFDEQGRLTDTAVGKQVSELLVALADWTLLLQRAQRP